MKTKMNFFVLAMTCITILLFAVPVFAANSSYNSSDNSSSQETGHRYDQQENGQNSNPPGGGQRREPPQEAINACNGKSAGDKIEFETPHGDTVSGTCVKNGDLLFAIPEGGHPPSRGERRQQNSN